MTYYTVRRICNHETIYVYSTCAYIVVIKPLNMLLLRKRLEWLSFQLKRTTHAIYCKTYTNN